MPWAWGEITLGCSQLSGRVYFGQRFNFLVLGLSSSWLSFLFFPFFPVGKVWFVLLQGFAIRLYTIHWWPPDLYQRKTGSAGHAPDRPTPGSEHLLWPMHTISFSPDWSRKMGRSQKCHLDPVGQGAKSHQNSNCTRVPFSLWNFVQTL